METGHINGLLKLTRALLFFNAAVWILFGILSFIKAADGGSTVRWMISMLMMANAVVMVGLGALIVSRRSWIISAATLYMGLNVVLTITDQFGLLDALILLINLSILGVVIFTRHRIKRTLNHL